MYGIRTKSTLTHEYISETYNCAHNILELGDMLILQQTWNGIIY